MPNFEKIYLAVKKAHFLKTELKKKMLKKNIRV